MLRIPALKTFPDAGVLIEGARGTGANRDRALRIFEDPDRAFLAVSFLYLAVVAKAAFNNRITARQGRKQSPRKANAHNVNWHLQPVPA
jgi:hypothetical protein